MALDLVHDVHGAYRLLVRATAFPGKVVDLQPIVEKTDLDLGVPPVILLLGLIVLDGEVSFSIAGNPEAGVALSEITGAPLSPKDDGAPFLFVAGAGTSTTEVLAAAPIGTLEDPQLGATVFIETAGLVQAEGLAGEPTSEARDTQVGHTQATAEHAGPLLALSGPGIQAECLLRVDRDASWIEECQQKNSEYPLGVDVFLFDPAGRVAAVPRTTKVEVPSWAT
jgi:alpha-D-ribose 1-methylphosphonate 5-triphosphate synthase subunit PhnH